MGGVERQKRSSTLALLRAVDNSLRNSRGEGLRAFSGGKAERVEDVGSLPVLVLSFDEASTNLAATQFLGYKAGLRILWLRDIFHREWNDCLLALQNCGFY